ncbi:kinase-like protein [Karstenula rhodostoma CBS 690.94]|uniref:Kinase-like protein n=1 Tax=Karstenula rhodostoma CBS 690.94 TaxID=1392251 RepID=A0A9P4PV59_9PLEO|nr:kinase-like protein [Karstenula rhodostoma CBS 690.94]
MMASFTLPYFADEASLPATLPTAEEIESATEILNERMSGASGKIVGVGDHFVVKYLQEGQTMLFLQHSSNIPVPRIYALYQKLGPDNNTYSYIVMERIKGPTLASVWLKIGQTEKEAVASELRHIFEEMYLNEAMIARYASEGYSKHKIQHFSRAFKNVFQNHAPVFTHADFQQKNVMFRKPPATTENGLVQWDSTDLELVIIDWEFAGWYPSYWEYSRALFGCGAWKDDWGNWIEKILEPYRNEYAWVLLFLTELFS